MWVFGYGSLMWDGWEAEFGCTRREQATLAGFRRDFNKSSVRNWGSEDTLCPTLGLDPDDGAECAGLAFEFPDSMCDRLCKWLLDREGSSFSLEQKEDRAAALAIFFLLKREAFSGQLKIFLVKLGHSS